MDPDNEQEQASYVDGQMMINAGFLTRFLWAPWDGRKNAKGDYIGPAFLSTTTLVALILGMLSAAPPKGRFTLESHFFFLQSFSGRLCWALPWCLPASTLPWDQEAMVCRMDSSSVQLQPGKTGKQ